MDFRANSNDPNLLGDNEPAGRVLAKSMSERGWRVLVPAMRTGLAALAVSLCSAFLVPDTAQAETRTLKLYFIHTKERAEITYKKNGKFIQSGLNDINRFLRDWRRNEPAKMDPRLLDLLWEVYRGVGARDHIHVVSAYRSPATNSMLRSRSKGVAEKSQHMLGKAIDFYIPGVPLSKLRAAGFKAEVGGVGYYPTSGSPFVHLDVGNVRSWPRMQRNELMALFPDGKTIHMPADGKPLPGYKAAMAAYQSRGKSSATIQMASASSGSAPRRGFLATLFGVGADEEEDSAESQVAAAPAPRPLVDRSATPQPVIAAAPAVEPRPETPETILAALPTRAVPLPVAAPRPRVDVGTPSLAAAVPEPVAPAVETEVALNVPIPTRRPNYTPPVVAVAAAVAPAPTPIPTPAPTPATAPALTADSAVAAVQLAGLAGSDDVTTGKVDAPAEPRHTLAAYSPVDSGRPAVGGGVMIAALPQSGMIIGGDGASNKAARIARAQAEQLVDQRLARLASAPSASPRLAVIAREAGIDPEVAVASGPKTTTKAAKPGPSDGQPDPRSVPIPVPQQVARWALSNEPVALDTRGTRAPSFAHAAVRAAPQMVYTEGFQASLVDGQPNRFAGKAVRFLSVARFETN